MQASLKTAKRVVIKLGTKVLTRGIGELDTERIASLCAGIAELRQRGVQVLVVSSGAVGLGMGRLGLSRRPNKLHSVQACAAVGQSILTETWQRGFAPHGLTVAQVLLTRDDVTSRRRHVAVKDLLEALLTEGIVPVINENDAISADEIRFGDNDVLSALVASVSKAEALLIVSTAAGLVDTEGTGEVIPVVTEITEAHRRMAGGTTDATSTGGMVTKLDAADIATRSGCGVFITSGAQPALLTRLFGDAPDGVTGTWFPPQGSELNSRRRHLAFFETAQGSVTVDDGARQAITDTHASLLAKGCIDCAGDFAEGEVIAVIGPGGAEIARGRSQFASEQLASILGKRRTDIATQFPQKARLEVIHRDDLVVL